MNLFPTPTRRTPLLGWESLTHTIQAMQKRGGLFPYAILVVLVGFAWTFLLTPGVGLGITFFGMVLLELFSPIDKLTIPAIRANLETLLLSGDPPTLAQALCVLSTGVITSEQEKQLKLKLVSILQGINPESVPILTDREKAAFDALVLSRNLSLVTAAKAVAPYFSQKDAARRELLRGSHKDLTPELLHPSQEIKPDVRELLHPSDEKDEKTEDNSD